MGRWARILNIFLVLIFLLGVQSPYVAKALTDEQKKAFRSGVYYFNTEDNDACSASTANQGDLSIGKDSGGEVKINFDEIAKKYPKFHSGIVKQINGVVIAAKNADQHPPAAASVLKLIIGDVYLRTNPDLSKSVTIKAHQVYDAKNTDGTAYAPKVGQSVKLKALLKEMLIHSSDTAPNVLIDEVGGLDAATDAAKKIGYKDTTIGSYYNSAGKPTKAVNRSTAKDLTVAMENIYTNKGLDYQIAQEALRLDEFDFGLGSEANKWGGTSLVTANSAVFAIGESKYIITLYFSAAWDGSLPSIGYNAKESEAVVWLREVTNQIVKTVKESATTPMKSSSDAPIDISFKEYKEQVDGDLVSELKSITQTIKPNISAYKAAASRWGIPWQAIAATHWREGTAGARKSMVNGTSLPTAPQLNGKEYIWGSADARIDIRSQNKKDIPIGNGGAPPRRFYGKLVQDIDYSTWLLIQHGVRPNHNPQFNSDPDRFIAKAQSSGLTKEEWTNTWSAYLGGASLGYGSFGRDGERRMGAGAIMAYLGGLVEKPPTPNVSKYPGASDEDYDKVSGGVDGSISTTGEGTINCANAGEEGIGGPVSANGYAFPIAAKKKSDLSSFGNALNLLPCNNSNGCHHAEKFSQGAFAFDLGVKGYGPDRSQNAPVYAISDGEMKHVTYERNNSPCNQFEFKSNLDGYVYWYGHLAYDASIKTGQKYKAGEQVGKVGPTICADNTAPHLHIDRGSPKGEDGGRECCRDKGIITLINKLYQGLPE